jgi:hypothetical protein
MGPVNWAAVGLAALLAAVIMAAWHRLPGGPGARGRENAGSNLRLGAAGPLASVVVMAVAATMLGHALARIGPDKLAVKPWLYWMQSGGLAGAFVIPAVWLTGMRGGVSHRTIARDAVGWMVAYLAMGTVFWAFGGR